MLKIAKFYYQDPNAPKPNKPNHMGVAAIIKKGNSILFERRKDCNRWSLIGGALETNESLVDGLKREVREETSLEFSNPKLFGIFSNPSRVIEYPDGNVIRVITTTFIVEVDDVSGLQISEESNELEFINVKSLPEIDIVETHKHILSSYLAWDHITVVVE